MWNDIVHNHSIFSLKKAKEQLDFFSKENLQAWKEKSKSQQMLKWQSPSRNQTCISLDAAVRDSFCTSLTVSRDSNGNIMKIWTSKSHSTNPVIAESLCSITCSKYGRTLEKGFNNSARRCLTYYISHTRRSSNLADKSNY